MSKLSSTYVNLEITVCGVAREVEADVKYIHSPAFGPIYDGSEPVSPEEPEMAEIQSVCIQDAGSDHAKRTLFDIMHLLTDDQIDAISTEVLEQGA